MDLGQFHEMELNNILLSCDTMWWNIMWKSMGMGWLLLERSFFRLWEAAQKFPAQNGSSWCVWTEQDGIKLTARFAYFMSCLSCYRFKNSWKTAIFNTCCTRVRNIKGVNEVSDTREVWEDSLHADSFWKWICKILEAAWIAWWKMIIWEVRKLENR